MGTPLGLGSACRGAELCNRSVSDAWHSEERLLAGPKLGQGEGKRDRKGREEKKTERSNEGIFLHLALFYTINKISSLCFSSQCPCVLENWVELCKGG